VFDDDSRYTLRQRVVAISLGRRFGARTSVRLVGGAVLGGDLEGDGRRYAVDTGWLASVVGAARLFGEGPGLFAIGTFAFGTSRAPAERVGGVGERETIATSDARVGLEVGWNAWGIWSPYVGARAFGGPVAFRVDGADRTGSDRHHYALGLGQSVSLGERFQLALDASLLGERSVSWGVSSSF